MVVRDRVTKERNVIFLHDMKIMQAAWEAQWLSISADRKREKNPWKFSTAEMPPTSPVLKKIYK